MEGGRRKERTERREGRKNDLLSRCSIVLAFLAWRGFGAGHDQEHLAAGRAAHACPAASVASGASAASAALAASAASSASSGDLVREAFVAFVASAASGSSPSRASCGCPGRGSSAAWTASCGAEAFREAAPSAAGRCRHSSARLTASDCR